MYCQSCGAKNTDDARFCNMCGTSLARAGEPGGPVGNATVVGGTFSPNSGSATAKDTIAQGEPPRSTPQDTTEDSAPRSSPAASASVPPTQNAWEQTESRNDSLLDMSLAQVGIRSSKKTWAFLGIFALLIGAAGAGLAVFFRGEPEGHAEPDDPFVIGTPDDVDTVAGTAGVTTSADLEETAESEESSAGSQMRSGSSGRRPSSMSSAMSRASSMGSTTASAMNSGSGTTGSSTNTSSGMTTSGSVSTSMGSADGSGSMGTGSGSTESGTGSGGGANSGSGGTSSSGSSTMDTTSDPGDRDIEMRMYSARVRYLIQQYYGSRAQTCFSRATSNSPTVSGTVMLALNIGGDGNVSSARVVRNTTGNEALGRCLSSSASGWRLSPPPGGEAITMQIPFSR